MTQIKLQLNTADLSEIKGFVLENDRHTLSTDFADFITFKLQETGVKCWLKNMANYLTTKKRGNFHVLRFQNKKVQNLYHFRNYVHLEGHIWSK